MCCLYKTRAALLNGKKEKNTEEIGAVRRNEEDERDRPRPALSGHEGNETAALLHVWFVFPIMVFNESPALFHRKALSRLLFPLCRVRAPAIY